MIEFVREPERFRAWVDSSGFVSRVIFVGMVIFQLIIALIPGEPLEMGAGYAFGAVEGTILCIIGCVIGSALVFLFVRRFGVKLVEVFFPREKIRSLRFLQDSRRLNLLTFIVFFIPGTPKDLRSLLHRPHRHETGHMASHHRRGPHPLDRHLDRHRRRARAEELSVRPHRLRRDAGF